MPEQREHARRVEVLISTVLRVGVVVSFVLVVAGTVITFVRDRGATLPHLHTPGAAMRHSLAAILAGVVHLDGPAIVMTGLLLLIATPVLRVAVSIWIFIHERDRAFIVITAVVLSLLILSFFLGQATM